MTLYEQEARPWVSPAGEDSSKQVLRLCETHDFVRAHQEQDRLRKLYGFAILTDSAMDKLRPYGPFLEVGSGSGYWAHELTQAGISVKATDPSGDQAYNHEPWGKIWTPVERLTALEAIRQYGEQFPALLICWPSYNQAWAYLSLVQWGKLSNAKTVVYVGEGNGGCTADDQFHEELEKNWESVKTIEIPQWPGIHDYIVIWRKR